MPRRPGQYVGERITIARKSRGWTQAKLAEQLNGLGTITFWRQSKIAKIENGEAKRLALDEALELAVALGVALAYLLSPTDETEAVQVTPKLACSPVDFRRWLRGDWPLVPEDERTFYFGELVPDSEWKRRLTAADEAGELVLMPGLVKEPPGPG